MSKPSHAFLTALCAVLLGLAQSPAAWSASLIDQAQAELMQLQEQTSDANFTCYLKAPRPANTIVSVTYFKSPYSQVKLAGKLTQIYLFAEDGRLVRYERQVPATNGLMDVYDLYFWRQQLLATTSLNAPGHRPVLRQQLIELGQSAGKTTAKPFYDLIKASEASAREALNRAQRAENCEPVRTVYQNSYQED